MIESSSIFSRLQQRQLGGKKESERSEPCPSPLALRLENSCILEGHEGCVNRMTWSPDGEMLASGSDDRNVRIWQRKQGDAWGTLRSIANIDTGHSNNIFGVGFMNSKTTIISGAMDMEVRLSRIETERVEKDYNCHRGRVKEVIVNWANDNIAWSASEDGTCRRFDCRETHVCGSTNCPNSVLHHDRPRPTAFKGIAQSPVCEHTLAFSCSDRFIRLFDIRKAPEPYLQLSPPHLKKYHHTTFVSFSSDGRQIVATYSGEHVYTFSLNDQQQQQQSLRLTTPPPPPDNNNNNNNVNVHSSYKCAPPSPYNNNSKHDTYLSTFPFNENNHLNNDSNNDNLNFPSRHQECVLQWKQKGNDAITHRDFTLAIYYYTVALRLDQGHQRSVLLVNRAFAFLKRNYKGDNDMALSDATEALAVEDENYRMYSSSSSGSGGGTATTTSIGVGKPQEPTTTTQGSQTATAAKAAYRRLLALKATQRISEAQRWLPIYKARFPAVKEFETIASELSKTKKPPRRRGMVFDSDDEGTSDGEEEEDGSAPSVGPLPEHIRMGFSQRYLGHANVLTDIKEACFWGNDLILSGSDDGTVFIWDRVSGAVVNILKASHDVINVVRGHPTEALLVTSGIDDQIKVWTPTRESPSPLAFCPGTPPHIREQYRKKAREDDDTNGGGNGVLRPRQLWRQRAAQRARGGGGSRPAAPVIAEGRTEGEHFNSILEANQERLREEHPLALEPMEMNMLLQLFRNRELLRRARDDRQQPPP